MTDMTDFTNPNHYKIYANYGIKRCIEENNGVDLEGGRWRYGYELDNELKGIYLSNLGRYYTKNSNKTYGCRFGNRCVFYRRFKNKLEKYFKIDEYLLKILKGDRPSPYHIVMNGVF